jgi:hypothetical protein
MPEHYLTNLQNKRLNEVIIPGSHDAGIYFAGKQNVRTQKLDIYDQAMAGVRWFDLRIATEKTGSGTGARYEQRAYHLEGTFVKDTSHFIRKRLPGGERDVASHQRVSHLGGWGGSLDRMLDDAKRFVQGHPNEFLILKFSKSYNLINVLDSCRNVLGAFQYKPGVEVNLNMMTVSALKGKVITIFSESDLRKLHLQGGIKGDYGGCYPYRELYDKKTESCKVYAKFYNGLQYFGKFSSTDKIAVNTRKQTRLLEVGAMGADRDAMGMMYWTTTGLFGSIRERNKEMWTSTNVQALQQTWGTGLETAIRAQLGHSLRSALDGGSFGRRGDWKAFMPNIVMMDFSSDRKCSIIQQLNNVAADELQRLFDNFSDLLE